MKRQRRFNRARVSANRPGGFTLLDTIIAALIIGILAVVAAPRFSQALRQFRLDAAAQRVKADLLLVRQAAMAASSPREVRFFPATEQYHAPALTSLDRASQGYWVSLAESPCQADIVATTMNDDTLTFNRFGLPAKDEAITLQVGGRQRVVVIDRDTGKARIP